MIRLCVIIRMKKKLKIHYLKKHNNYYNEYHN